MTIEVNPDTGDMTYRPSVLHASRGDSVTWICRNGDFTLEFFADTPFRAVSHRGASERDINLMVDKIIIRGLAGKEVTETVAADAPSGTYPYSVAVAVDRKIFVDRSCPDIIIE